MTSLRDCPTEPGPRSGTAGHDLFGDKLRVARALANLSLRDVSEAVGVSYNAISKYETGKMTPKSSVLAAMAKLYGVDLDWLMCSCPIQIGWHQGACADGVRQRVLKVVSN